MFSDSKKNLRVLLYGNWFSINLKKALRSQIGCSTVSTVKGMRQLDETFQKNYSFIEKISVALLSLFQDELDPSSGQDSVSVCFLGSYRFDCNPVELDNPVNRASVCFNFLVFLEMESNTCLGFFKTHKEYERKFHY